MVKLHIKFGWLSVLTALLWIIIIAAVMVIWTQTGHSETRYLRELDRTLESMLRSEMPHIAKLLEDGDYDGVRRLCSPEKSDSDIRLTVIAPDGEVIADSRVRYNLMDNHMERPEIEEVRSGQPVSRQMRFSSTAHIPSLYCAIPLEVNSQRYIIRGSLSMNELERTMRTARQNLLLVGIAVAAVLSALSFYVVHKVIFPLRRLRKTANRIAAGELDLPLPPTGPGEVGRLALPLGMLAEQLKMRYEEVRRQKLERDLIFDAMREGVVMLNSAGALSGYNEAARKMFHLTGQVRNQPFLALVRFAELKVFLEKVKKQAGPVEEELLLQLSDSVEPRYLRVRGVMIGDTVEKLSCILLVFSDITRIRKLENFRRDFIADVSHEIKTPLTVIQGAAETLLDGALEDPAGATRFLDIIQTHCRRLNLLVQDILSISNLEEKTTRATEDFVELDAGDIVRTAVELCRPRLLEKQHLEVSIPDTPCEVAGDSANLEQAVVNLVDNAIKYAGEEATIRVTVIVTERNVVIAVADNGVGIAPVHLERLFERFYRVDKARSRKAGGTGLGLAIVKHIVQWHRGQTEVTSEVGKGTTFRMILPRATKSGEM